MKYIIFLFLLSLPILASAQGYEIESVTDSTVALKETAITADSLENVTYLTGAIDSASMIQSIFGFIRAKRTGQARAIRQAKEREREATALNAISNAFSDSLYFDWTQANHASRFLAAGNLPNYRLRVGANLYWARCSIAGNGSLRMEVTTSSGQLLNPRDNAPMFIHSPESFRLNPLLVTGERVEFVLYSQDTRRKTWEGQKADGTLIRLTQLLDR